MGVVLVAVSSRALFVNRSSRLAFGDFGGSTARVLSAVVGGWKLRAPRAFPAAAMEQLVLARALAGGKGAVAMLKTGVCAPAGKE